MLLRQLLDPESSSYTYLLAERAGTDAVLIDPVKAQLDAYLTRLEQLDLRLAYAVDTHTHADHITALGVLRERTGCITLMGEYSEAQCVTDRLRDGQILQVGSLELQALHTPGHTHESFSLVLNPQAPQAVFTGDALLIRGTGRTDLQGGDPHQSWNSIVNKLFALPDDALVYPGHDYKGCTRSTIGEEKRLNPRLFGKSEAEYVELMNQLGLPRPAMVDIAIAANLACGRG